MTLSRNDRAIRFRSSQEAGDDNAPNRQGCYRLAAKVRVVPLLDRGIERVHVDVNNLPHTHPASMRGQLTGATVMDTDDVDCFWMEDPHAVTGSSAQSVEFKFTSALLAYGLCPPADLLVPAAA
jgi:hypothetical protein